MAQQNIVGGLFGVTPEMYQRQQDTAQQAQAIQFAGLTPAQQAQFNLYRGGQQLGNAGAGLLGAQDPELMKIRDVQAMRSEFDVSSPTGLRSFAQALGQKGYTDLAIQATAKAADIDKDISVTQKNRAENIKQVGLTTDGRQVYQSGASQFVLTEQGPQPYYGKLESKQSKTEITGLDKIFDKAFTTQEAKDQADVWNKAGDAYRDAAKVGRTVRDMEAIVGSAFIGPYGTLQAGLSRAFGGGKRLSDTEVFDALSSQLVTPLAKTLPGSLAVKELEQLIKQKPNIKQSEPTIRKLLNQINQDIKASEITYEAGEAYRNNNNGRISGFNPNITNNKATKLIELREKFTRTNKLSDAEKAEAKKLAEELNVKDL